MIKGDEIEGEAEVPGTKARFHLVHNLMEVPRENPNEYVRLKRFPPELFETIVDWTTTQVRRRPSGRR